MLVSKDTTLTTSFKLAAEASVTVPVPVVVKSLSSMRIPLTYTSICPTVKANTLPSSSAPVNAV